MPTSISASGTGAINTCVKELSSTVAKKTSPHSSHLKRTRYRYSDRHTPVAMPIFRGVMPIFLCSSHRPAPGTSIRRRSSVANEIDFGTQFIFELMFVEQSPSCERPKGARQLGGAREGRRREGSKPEDRDLPWLGPGSREPGPATTGRAGRAVKRYTQCRQ